LNFFGFSTINIYREKNDIKDIYGDPYKLISNLNWEKKISIERSIQKLYL